MARRETMTRDAGLLATARQKYGIAQPRCGCRGNRRSWNQLRRDRGARTRQDGDGAVVGASSSDLSKMRDLVGAAVARGVAVAVSSEGVGPIG